MADGLVYEAASDIMNASMANSTLAASTLPTTAPSSLGLLGIVGLSMLKVIPTALLWIVTMITITAPKWVYWLLSNGITFTVNFSTLVIMFMVAASSAGYYFRYRFHTYARLPAEPPRKETEVEIFPGPQVQDTKPARLNSYIDEFMSAIKVFGYLEKPVFHELTRTMQTRKLVAGETLILEEEKGFCIIVEGTMQIFARSRREEKNAGYNSDDEHYEGDSHHGYQLLTEVKNGAPLSSLFSILALFTEDIKLKPTDGSGEKFNGRVPSMNRPIETPPDPSSPLDSPSFHGPNGRLPNTSSPSIADPLLPITPLDLGTSPSKGTPILGGRQTRAQGQKHASAHPDIVARAATDCTIAVIPGSAFRRLTQGHPKATAHIIQVILTKFYRVTLATGHQYLGLTQEILKTEKSINRFTHADLPDFLRDDALDTLKAKFAMEREKLDAEEIRKGIALHNAQGGKRRRSSSLRRDLTAQARLHSARAKNFGSAERALSPVMERSGISAGDLLSNPRSGPFNFSQPMTGLTPHPRSRPSLGSDYFQPMPVVDEMKESIGEDEMFRESILDCMCKAMGLDNINTPQAAGSTDQSPRLVSFDSRKQKAVFHNTAMGLMGGISDDGDSESVTSVPSTINALQNQNLFEDLIDEIDIVYFQKGAVLVEQQERLPGLYYIVDGFLETSITLEPDEGSDGEHFNPFPKATVPTPGAGGRDSLHEPSLGLHRTTSAASSQKQGMKQSLFLLKPGSLAGYLPAVSGFRSFVNVTAKSDVIVGFLPRKHLERLVERYPVILLTLAKRLTAVLDRVILHIDFALEYLQFDAGQVVYDQGDSADAIYVVLNGRLRAIEERADKTIRVLGEYGQGESVGELEVLTETRRPGSLHAQRDTEVAKLPKLLFNSLAQEHPAITMKMSKILARRMRSLVEGHIPTAMDRPKAAGALNPASNLNIRTVCIMPVTSGIPVAEFASKLTASLSQLGTTVMLLNQSAILNHLGRHAFNRTGKLKLTQYLADLEEKYGLVLYIADTSVQSPWTTTCITQSDCVLLLALADGSSDMGEYERLLLTVKTTARKELVLIHNERLCPPGLTRKFLRERHWINGGHHHIQMAFRSTPEPIRSPNRRLGSAIKQRVQTIQTEIQKYTGRRVRRNPVYATDSPIKGDFHRLARKLMGKSIGLVLGGGGARGIAHVGIIRALEEAGIPIDMVGGTSIGAFVGALYAWDANVVPMYGRMKRFAGRTASMWRFVLDLTYPTASWTTGHEFNRGIFKTFGDYLIEDFWLPYYCNTTNISQSRCDFHTSGYVWRYVRASMSLAGLLPPLCDQGDMLLDGGYIDNLTVEHMKSMGADVIFAVDVGSQYEQTPQEFGDSLSGYWTLFNRWNPFSNTPNPPSLSEIQSRLAYVSSVDMLERAKNTPGCHYMRPAVDPYGTLQFGSFDEIYKVGYDYGKGYFEKMRADKVLPLTGGSEDKKDLRRTTMARRASI